MKLHLLAALLATVLVHGGCERMSEADCEKACLHHAQLWFEDQWAEKLASAPESERAALEAEKASAWQKVESDPDAPGRHHCVKTCIKRGSREKLDCIFEAKTLAAGKACWEEED